MNTTSIIVELLTAGVLALVAVLLLVSAFTTDIVAQILAQPGHYVVLIAGTLMAFAYSLGVLVDALADHLMRSPRRAPPPSEPTLFLTLGAEFQAAFLGYLRTKLRLSRNFCINAVLLAGSGSLYLWVRGAQTLPWVWLLIWGVVAAGAYLAWRELDAEWTERRRQMMARPLAAPVPVPPAPETP